MTSFIDRIIPTGPRPKPLKPGLYHYASKDDAPRPFRLHLRVEPDGTGVLIVNAAIVLHLNATATEHAYQFVQGASDEAAAKAVASRYRVGWAQSLADQRALREQVVRLALSPDVDPVMYLDMERTTPHVAQLSAPYRLDLALTYTTDPKGEMDPEARRRVDRELSTEEWRKVMSTAWDAGIPHVTFTGGEPLRRGDVAALVGHGESLGQVTGVLTGGGRLADAAVMRELEQAGLDHILLVLDLRDAQSKAGLKNALDSDVFTAVHLTLSPDDARNAFAELRALAEMGVPAVSLSARAKDPAVLMALGEATERVAELGMDLIWDLPVPYSVTNPISLEVEEHSPGAGRSWLYVEPDGDVLPAQGLNEVLGNMLTDPWAMIWERAGS
jgi:MoaA/NifB/PqqE/SkfB family radical SAM enzyme